MHIRTAIESDFSQIAELHKKSLPNFNETWLMEVLKRSLADGLLLVALHPVDENQIIGEIHGAPHRSSNKSHVFSDFNLVVDPSFQNKKIGRTLFTIFLEEVGRNRHEVGKIELVVPESNSKAIALFQSMGFLIEGRMEMRIKNGDGSYEADIPMGWQNPNFQFD